MKTMGLHFSKRSGLEIKILEEPMEYMRPFGISFKKFVVTVRYYLTYVRIAIIRNNI